MKRIIQTGNKRILRVIMVFVMLLAFVSLSSMSAYAESISLKLTAQQMFSSSSASTMNSEFTYVLYPLESGNPMPAESTEDGYFFSIIGKNSIDIELDGFVPQTKYTYELSPVIVEERPGYTYDRRIYTIEVYVFSSVAIEVVLLNEDDTKAEAIVFENSYESLPSDRSLMVDPPVKKTVSGDPTSESVFTFKLVAQDPSQPMPPGSVGGVKTVQVIGSGESEFGDWSYDKEGVYYYSVYEENRAEPGYTYDTAVYTITDVVSDENGQLILSRTVTNDSNKQVTSLTFINTYDSDTTSPPQENVFKPGIAGPLTGDDSDTLLYIVSLVLGSVLVSSAALYLIPKRKRNKAQ